MWEILGTFLKLLINKNLSEGLVDWSLTLCPHLPKESRDGMYILSEYSFYETDSDLMAQKVSKPCCCRLFRYTLSKSSEDGTCPTTTEWGAR